MFIFSLVLCINLCEENDGRCISLRFLTFDYIKELIFTIPAVLLAISAHEFAHGYVSYKMGDPTPKTEGRLTINPLAHMDIAGSICLLIFKMGWAKPVKINPYYYKDRKKGIIAVSLAGPLMNYLLAFIGMILFAIFYEYKNEFGIWCYYFTLINVGLGTFNLLPFPPLDGSNVLAELVPRVKSFYYRIERYSMPILVICLATGFLEKPMNFISDAVINLLWRIVTNILDIGIIIQSGIFM